MIACLITLHFGEEKFNSPNGYSGEQNAPRKSERTMRVSYSRFYKRLNLNQVL